MACNATSEVFFKYGTDARTEIEEQAGYFDYIPLAKDSTEIEWYPNFAHSDLFCAYGGSLFAQDEMQVAEHPALGSLREALLAEDVMLLTVEAGMPTPITIRGIERRCAIATDANAEQGRPFGLYGNYFARAKPEAIQLATTPLNLPTITNIIAMEAPPGGYGIYTDSEIEYILVTALTAFSAARIDSCAQSNRGSRVTIHTGFWGCGAYGGNRVLMALLQLLAAHLAKIDRLVFHTGSVARDRDFATAQAILKENLIAGRSTVELSALIGKIHAMDFPWGISDGN
ncbi:hypothetical protein IQ249_00280 [Lusitaniella coriacea LEGE 07157]|uniref:PARG catalytic Macro domain-containing protein n=1 Tax=Lusitaniella coriacea LEGE 07157 TaxID=945747 RepID=A0A8J7DL69_9CYAN|nr:hypothetical protein [Lusitaniella coriacea]MBE9114323.1 hypothetical protein [Lusitaniella coriacea LEGE 07157]